MVCSRGGNLHSLYDPREREASFLFVVNIGQYICHKEQARNGKGLEYIDINVVM